MATSKVFLSFCLTLVVAQLSSLSVSAASSKSSKKTSHRNHGYFLVPPPPPTPVSPTVLASYGRSMGGMSMGAPMRFIPSKPKLTVAEDMKLTAVMDDMAFFKFHSSEETVHLRKGACYQNVTVAQINPDEVVLEEKGKQFVKRLQ